MLHLARYRGLVVGILRLMVSLCVVISVEGLHPTQLLAAGALKASWNANTEPDLAGFKIYYGLSSGNYTISINVGNVTQYTVNQLTEGRVYYFVVTAYDTAGNESAYSQEVSGQIPVVDSTPPSVTSVKLLDPGAVEIKFSEAVTLASAQNIANYVIDNGIVVASAALQADNVTVKLATSAHVAGKDYNIVFRNIKDRSPAANTIAAGTTITYSLFDNSNGGNTSLSVNGLKPARYSVDSLQVGSTYYIDRTYVIQQIPKSKLGLLWIKTASADRNDTGEPFIEFTLTRESNIYVAYDSRAQQPPDWLKRNFVPTNELIAVSENNIKLKLWQQHFLPGRVALGGNMASGVQTFTSLSMYLVLVQDGQAPPTNNSPAPQSFLLFQNYPNPFSATGGIGGISGTTIKYYLQEQHQVVLTVHNKLGQVIRELKSGLVPAGYHTLTWDGRDESGQALPSGNYLCTLEVRDEVANAGFAMSASLNRQTKVITLLK